MALPKLSHPTFKLTIPSTKQLINFRPFTVKEEKLILIAQTDENLESKISTIKQLISNCVSEEIDVDSLAIFDIEYIFINLRAKSVDNMLKFIVTDADDGKKYEVEVDLNLVEVNFTDLKQNKIQLTDEVGVIMKYPSFAMAQNVEKLFSTVDTASDYIDSALKVFVSCIDTIYDNDTVYVAGKDFTQEQAVEFISSISSSTFEKFDEFFKNLPTISVTGKYKNSLGAEKEAKIRGISDFFT